MFLNLVNILNIWFSFLLGVGKTWGIHEICRWLDRTSISRDNMPLSQLLSLSHRFWLTTVSYTVLNLMDVWSDAAEPCMWVFPWLDPRNNSVRQARLRPSAFSIWMRKGISFASHLPSTPVFLFLGSSQPILLWSMPLSWFCTQWQAAHPYPRQTPPRALCLLPPIGTCQVSDGPSTSWSPELAQGLQSNRSFCRHPCLSPYSSCFSRTRCVLTAVRKGFDTFRVIETNKKDSFPGDI